MLSFLPGPVKGVLGFVLLVINLLFWFAVFFPFALVKLCLPVPQVRNAMDFCLNFIATSWAHCNKLLVVFLNDIKWHIDVDGELSKNEWYLVLSNHQSWADAVIFMYVLNGRIPYFRYFIKQELMWVPILNIVWYALDYPRMKRYSRSFLEKNPQFKGKDIESAKKSCERFKLIPVSVMNFVEGTRFTKKKYDKQQSPYRYLLRPKAGGIAFVIAAMGDQLSAILDVTVHYRPKAMGLWSFLCGRISGVTVHVRKIPITDEIKGEYFEDDVFKNRFQEWVNDLWKAKDQLLERMANT